MAFTSGDYTQIKVIQNPWSIGISRSVSRKTTTNIPQKIKHPVVTSPRCIHKLQDIHAESQEFVMMVAKIQATLSFLQKCSFDATVSHRRLYPWSCLVWYPFEFQALCHPLWKK